MCSYFHWSLTEHFGWRSSREMAICINFMKKMLSQLQSVIAGVLSWAELSAFQLFDANCWKSACYHDINWFYWELQQKSTHRLCREEKIRAIFVGSLSGEKWNEYKAIATIEEEAPQKKWETTKTIHIHTWYSCIQVSHQR